MGPLALSAMDGLGGKSSKGTYASVLEIIGHPDPRWRLRFLTKLKPEIGQQQRQIGEIGVAVLTGLRHSGQVD